MTAPLTPGPAYASVTDADTRWRQLKFGLMMHWGLYSVAGGVWQGQQIEGYNEQIMHRARIPWPEYLTLSEGFTAAGWDPEAIVGLAHEAGMRYVVLTSKHHDGFNLWHTRLSNFNPVEATPAGRDVLQSLADACARQQMHLGLYYSLIDWHYPGAAPMSDTNSDPLTPALELYTVGQLRELLTGYGPLCEIWFDMGAPTPEQSRIFADLVHQLQPQCRLNGRIWNGYDDFMECADNETPEFWFDGPWESPVTMFVETWGYRSWQERGSVDAKVREKVRELAFITARGGNYLLNLGPRGDGSLVDFDVQVLRGIGRWMAAHGEAVYEGEPQPHLTLDCGYATARPGRLYLYVTDPPADGVLRVPGWIASEATACLLGQNAPLPCTCEEDGLRIDLPAESLDPYLPIVAVDYPGGQAYRPRDAVAVSGAAPVVLDPAGALLWHRMEGADYGSVRRFVVAREWVLWPEETGPRELVLRRPRGGAAAGFLVAAGDEAAQFIFAESAEAQEQALRVDPTAGEPVTVTLRDLRPRAELRDEGLELEVRLRG